MKLHLVNLWSYEDPYERGVNIVKVRHQRHPDSDDMLWKNGFCLVVLNFGVALLWGRCR
jgi:hypothetical protein